jgi:hypothetical protein
MRITRNTWWLTITEPIIGFDDEGAAGEGAGQEGSGEGKETSEGEGGGDDGGEDVTGLKSALARERADRKKLEKDLLAFQKKQKAAEDAEKSEVERLKGQNETTSAKAAKLAAGFKRTAVEAAILKAAGAAKFLDPSDALRPEVIAAIGVEQDEDDPSQVTIDEATVTEAVKKLATTRKHYVSTGVKPPVPKSGSTYGGAAGAPKGDAATEELKRKYPALRGL